MSIKISSVYYGYYISMVYYINIFIIIGRMRMKTTATATNATVFLSGKFNKGLVSQKPSKQWHQVIFLYYNKFIGGYPTASSIH